MGGGRLDVFGGGTLIFGPSGGALVAAGAELAAFGTDE